MVPDFAALTIAGMLAVAPASATRPASLAAPSALRPADILASLCAPVGTRLDASRLGLHRGRSAPGTVLRYATSLGAALAWDLADLPRHRARLPEPIGEFTPGAAFGAHLGAPGAREDGAIGALIVRWNTLYPPYALEGMNDH